jgi:TRAP-type C4-dicarboxylate transport system substrate-binding protein
VSKTTVFVVLALSWWWIVSPSGAVGDDLAGRQFAQRERPGAKALEGARGSAQQWKAAWEALSPEPQKAVAESMESASQDVRNLSPEKKQAIQESAKKAAASAKSMTPEQKDKVRQEVQKSAEACKQMTPEQKQQFLSSMGANLEKVQGMTPEQRKRLVEAMKAQIGG